MSTAAHGSLTGNAPLPSAQQESKPKEKAKTKAKTKSKTKVRLILCASLFGTCVMI